MQRCKIARINFECPITDYFNRIHNLYNDDIEVLINNATKFRDESVSIINSGYGDSKEEFKQRSVIASLVSERHSLIYDGFILKNKFHDIILVDGGYELIKAKIDLMYSILTDLESDHKLKQINNLTNTRIIMFRDIFIQCSNLKNTYESLKKIRIRIKEIDILLEAITNIIECLDCLYKPDEQKKKCRR